jgi:hypothetical protein
MGKFIANSVLLQKNKKKEKKKLQLILEINK